MTEAARERKEDKTKAQSSHREGKFLFVQLLEPRENEMGTLYEKDEMITDNEVVFHLHQDVPLTLSLKMTEK